MLIAITGSQLVNPRDMFVCFITKSFLTYSFFFHLYLLYQPYLGLCQAQCFQSHQRQPMSAVAITACEIQVSAADSQTVPTVAWPVRTYRYIPLYYLYWFLYILTPITVVQGVDNHSWGLYCRRCYCIRVCWGRYSRIFHFSRWLGQLSTVLTKDESPHTGYTFTPWVVSFTPPRIEH